MKTQVIIPFRDRGLDPRRGANLDVVMAWWFAHGMEAQVVDDGLEGDAQFNRHRAYNRAVSRNSDADVFVFTEADMLIHPLQVRLACQYAADQSGLVVPFTHYRYLSDSTTDIVRSVYEDRGVTMSAEWWAKPPSSPASIFGLTPEYVMDNGRSIGAINVMSRETLDLTGGFTEATSGNWYDDNIIEEGFKFLTGYGTRYVSGPAVHLYHLPGHTGDHLTERDIAATRHNKELLLEMRHHIRQGQHGIVRELMKKRTAR